MIQPTVDPVISEVLAGAEIVVFEGLSDGSFRVLSGKPAWFELLLGDAIEDCLDLRGRFPPLDHFLGLARDHWRHGDAANSESSGLWIEVRDGEEIPLEATARKVDGRSLLIVRSPKQRYREVQGTLQRARESLLENEVLERAVEERTEMIREREEEIAVRLVSAAEFRDSATGAHIRRIGGYTVLMAAVMRLPARILDHLELAAAMHDVGKIGIPDHILLKPGPLDDEEREIMQRHTVFGARILEDSDTPALALGREIALSHHERWDGTGYPHGLAGREIPRVARIVSVVDFFDAMVNDRPYRKALPPEEVLATMRTLRGKHFDPEILDLFLLLQPQIAEIRREVDREGAEGHGD